MQEKKEVVYTVKPPVSKYLPYALLLVFFGVFSLWGTIVQFIKVPASEVPLAIYNMISGILTLIMGKWTFIFMAVMSPFCIFSGVALLVLSMYTKSLWGLKQISLKPGKVVFRKRSGKEKTVTVRKVESIMDGVRFVGQDIKGKHFSKDFTYDHLDQKDVSSFKGDVTQMFNTSSMRSVSPSFGDLESEIENYTKAIEKKTLEDKPDYMMNYKRACAYEKMGKMEKAANDFRAFLLADDRELKTSLSIAGIGEAFDSFTIGMQRETAKSRLTKQTLQKVFCAFDFDVEYSNKKLYDWENEFKEATKMLKDNPQKATYRMGVILLLQGRYIEAIKYLNEVIEINPENAIPYFFRGIAHVLQSRNEKFFDQNHGAKELTKAMIDFKQTIALKKDPALIKQVSKWKKNVIRLSSKYKY